MTHRTALLVTFIIFTSFDTTRAFAQDNDVTAKIQYDLLLLDILETSEWNAPKKPLTNKFYILPTDHQGDFLQIKLKNGAKSNTSIVFEIRDMVGEKMLGGILPTNQLIDISALGKQLHVVTLHSIDSLMEFDLVVESY